MKGSACVEFLQWALPRLGYRWPGFRKVRGQVCKRIRRRMQELACGGFDAYRKRLDDDPDEWDVVDSYCRITISRFYRDKGVFRTIADIVLPELAEQARSERREVKCWCAGCASGEEVYTLKLLWDLDGPGSDGMVKFTVLGTDIDQAVLSRAAAGRYDAASLRELPKPLLQRGFDHLDDVYCVKNLHRCGITFLRQDIRHAMPSGPFDLVLCRNLVLTYFEPALQLRLVKELAERLAPSGYLVVGSHEALPPGISTFNKPLAGCREILRRTF